MNAFPEYSFHLADEEETLNFGARLAQMLESGDVVALYGDLGMGKTTLSRGLIKSLIPELEDVPSPTYTIVQVYEPDAFQLWHFDLYRLDDPSEVIEIGLEEALIDVCLIEWPEKAGNYLPQSRLSVTLKPDGTGRLACLAAGSKEWADRLEGHFGHD